MTEYSKVFLDTTPLIYFLDADENFGERTRLILEEILTSGRMVVSSVITCMEYLVYPYRTGNRQKIDSCHKHRQRPEAISLRGAAYYFALIRW